MPKYESFVFTEQIKIRTYSVLYSMFSSKNKQYYIRHVP